MKIPANGFTHAGKFHADDVFATDCINPQPRNGICRPGLLLYCQKTVTCSGQNDKIFQIG